MQNQAGPHAATAGYRPAGDAFLRHEHAVGGEAGGGGDPLAALAVQTDDGIFRLLPEALLGHEHRRPGIAGLLKPGIDRRKPRVILIQGQGQGIPYVQTVFPGQGLGNQAHRCSGVILRLGEAAALGDHGVPGGEIRQGLYLFHRQHRHAVVGDVHCFQGRLPGGGAVHDLPGGDALRKLLDRRQVIAAIVHRLHRPQAGIPVRGQGFHHPGIPDHIGAQVVRRVHGQAEHLRPGGGVPITRGVRGQLLKRLVQNLLLLAGPLVIADQVVLNVQGPGVQLHVGVPQNFGGDSASLLPLRVVIGAGQQQISLPRLRPHGGVPIAVILGESDIRLPSGGVPQCLLQAVHPLHLPGYGPCGLGVGCPLLGRVLALLDLPCQDLQDEVCIGGVRGRVHCLAAIVTAEIVQIQQRRQIGRIAADQAHPGPGPNDAPVLLFRLFQEPGRFPCGGGTCEGWVGIPRLLGPTGDHRHGGVGRLHPGPGPGCRPELAPGQGQDHPR